MHVILLIDPFLPKGDDEVRALLRSLMHFCLRRESHASNNQRQDELFCSLRFFSSEHGWGVNDVERKMMAMLKSSKSDSQPLFLSGLFDTWNVETFHQLEEEIYQARQLLLHDSNNDVYDSGNTHDVVEQVGEMLHREIHRAFAESGLTSLVDEQEATVVVTLPVINQQESILLATKYFRPLSYSSSFLFPMNVVWLDVTCLCDLNPLALVDASSNGEHNQQQSNEQVSSSVSSEQSQLNRQERCEQEVTAIGNEASEATHLDLNKEDDEQLLNNSKSDGHELLRIGGPSNREAEFAFGGWDTNELRRLFLPFAPQQDGDDKQINDMNETQKNTLNNKVSIVGIEQILFCARAHISLDVLIGHVPSGMVDTSAVRVIQVSKSNEFKLVDDEKNVVINLQDENIVKEMHLQDVPSSLVSRGIKYFLTLADCGLYDRFERLMASNSGLVISSNIKIIETKETELNVDLQGPRRSLLFVIIPIAIGLAAVFEGVEESNSSSTLVVAENDQMTVEEESLHEAVILHQTNVSNGKGAEQLFGMAEAQIGQGEDKTQIETKQLDGPQQREEDNMKDNEQKDAEKLITNDVPATFKLESTTTVPKSSVPTTREEESDYSRSSHEEAEDDSEKILIVYETTSTRISNSRAKVEFESQQDSLTTKTTKKNKKIAGKAAKTSQKKGTTTEIAKTDKQPKIEGKMCVLPNSVWIRPLLIPSGSIPELPSGQSIQNVQEFRSKLVDDFTKAMDRILKQQSSEQNAHNLSSTTFASSTLDPSERAMFASKSDSDIAVHAKDEFFRAMESLYESQEDVGPCVNRFVALARLIKSDASKKKLRDEVVKKLPQSNNSALIASVLILLRLKMPSESISDLNDKLRRMLNRISIAWSDQLQFSSFLKESVKPACEEIDVEEENSGKAIWNQISRHYLDDETTTTSPLVSSASREALFIRRRQSSVSHLQSRRNLLPLVPAFTAQQRTPTTTSAAHHYNVASSASFDENHTQAPPETVVVPKVPLVGAGRKRQLNHFTESLADPSDLRRIVVVPPKNPLDSKAFHGSSSLSLSSAAHHSSAVGTRFLHAPRVLVRESPGRAVEPTPRPAFPYAPSRSSAGAAQQVSKKLFLTPGGPMQLSTPRRPYLQTPNSSSFVSVGPSPVGPSPLMAVKHYQRPSVVSTGPSPTMSVSDSTPNNKSHSVRYQSSLSGFAQSQQRIFRRISVEEEDHPSQLEEEEEQIEREI